MKPLNAFVGLVAAGWLVVGCASPGGSSRLFVGRWQEVGTAATITFHADGRADVAAGPITVTGRYTYKEPGKLRIELPTDKSETKATTYSATVSGDQMRLVDSEGAHNDYVRIP